MVQIPPPEFLSGHDARIPYGYYMIHLFIDTINFMRLLKLLFIRHAQSVGNQQKRMQGQAEFELSLEGRHQAEKLAQRLLTEGWRPSYVYTSPLKRTVQTAELLLARFLADPLPSNISDLMDGEVDAPMTGLTTAELPANNSSGTEASAASNTASSIKVGTNTASTSNIGSEPGLEFDGDDAFRSPASTTTAATAPRNGKRQTFQTREGDITVEYADELQEHQNGIFQGLTWAEARAQYPDLCHALESSPDWIPVPGAESLQTARDRSHQFIQRLLDRHTDGEQIWIITHSWIMQHLISELMGCDRSWRLHAHNTALFEFWIDRSRWQRADQNRFNTDLWQIRRFNDYQHLSSGDSR
jgi:broad specificity phosphatase PhoE